MQMTDNVAPRRAWVRRSAAAVVDVEDLRRSVESGQSFLQIARYYGVSWGAIKRLVIIHNIQRPSPRSPFPPIRHREDGWFEAPASDKPLITVYIVRHLETGRCYVGQTIAGIRSRLSTHLGQARAGKTKAHIGRALLEHGVNGFEVEIVAECGIQSDADKLERHWIKQLNSIEPHGYNVEPGGKSGFVRPKSVTDRIGDSSRGRPNLSCRGELSPISKLTTERVLEIRRRYSEGETNKAGLGREYGVARSTIARIVKRKVWQHLP